MRFYIDSNIFIYAVTQDEKSELCRKIISKLEEDEFKAATSILTLDEVTWIVNELDDEKAVETGKRLLKMSNLDILSADIETGAKSLDIMNDDGIDPRDSMHLATAEKHGIYTIVTEDSDMQENNQIDSINAQELLEKIK